MTNTVRAPVNLGPCNLAGVYIRDGVVVVAKGAVIPAGTII